MENLRLLFSCKILKNLAAKILKETRKDLIIEFFQVTSSVLGYYVDSVSNTLNQSPYLALNIGNNQSFLTVEWVGLGLIGWSVELV